MVTDFANNIEQGEKLFNEGNYSEAEIVFREILTQNRNQKQVWNNLGVIEFRKNNLAEAVKCFELALQIDSGYREAYDNMMAIKQKLGGKTEEKSRHEYYVKDKKIAIVNVWENKFNAIYKSYFDRNNDVKVILPQTGEDLKSAAEWADVVWSTWCNEPLVALSQQKLPCKLITHIRSYEILTESFMTNTKWENIDGAIFVADHIRDIAKEMWPAEMIQVPRTVVHNCVELDKYPFYDKQPGKDIAYVSYLNHKKGISLLLQCIKAAVDCDPEYKFHIAGVHQEARFEVYMNHLLKAMNLQDNVIFHGWVKDIQKFMANMNYSISTSPWEGCPNNVIEAMACGVKTIVHNWRGADDMFPHELVFNSIEDFMRILTEDKYDSKYYREFVEKNFNAEIQVNKIDKFIAEVLSK